MPNTIEWSEDEMQRLIDLRKERNDDYWRRFGRSKVPFWNEIAEQIETDLGTTFTGIQAREKFKGMMKDCNVSKILVNKKTIKFILIIFTKSIYLYLILIFLVI
jgi:hypothetical protein